ncbi:MAG: malate synthase A [Oligoflexia bacterium]|nr:malate synthase A [Oligoflexia bacterium]
MTPGQLVQKDLEILGKMSPEYQQILNSDALKFLVELHRRFGTKREDLLRSRIERQHRIDAGEKPAFLTATSEVRASHWKVAEVPSDLQDRRVEITGPVEAKMMINALNSGAKVFMADFEDACSPTWENVLTGQINCSKAIRRTLTFTNPDGKTYKLNENTATLVIRPRGWHLTESHCQIDNKPISASLFDFGLYMFHNARELLKRGTGPYFYLPKLESHLEARLWNEVFNFSQDYLGITRGTIRATVLVETILASLEMEEILFELRDHICALNAGRWDYIFSAIKKFRNDPKVCFPDRSSITMTVPFMRAYTELLVKTCHKRGAHAIGGMAAFIPSRRDPQVNEVALKKVREDKNREANDGFDGTWVAHPDLVPVAMEIFNQKLGVQPHQKNRTREEVSVKASDLLNFQIPQGQVTENGVRNNISVALQYLEAWLRGLGAVGIFNLMEDAATAEISRAELWQWVHQQTTLSSGERIDSTLYKKWREEELQKLDQPKGNKFGQAVEILDGLVLSQSFAEFLTIPAYKYLTEIH